jgi:hypothetical protein
LLKIYINLSLLIKDSMDLLFELSTTNNNPSIDEFKKELITFIRSLCEL